MPRLIIMARNGNGRQIDITTAITTIGRDRGSRVCIDSDRVSRQHAVIRRTGRHFAVTDMGSSNGTYVNDDLVFDQSLCNGDAITIGDYQLRFLHSGSLLLPGEALRLLTRAGELRPSASAMVRPWQRLKSSPEANAHRSMWR